MFTLVKSILLKPLAYPEPDRLVRIIQNSPYETANHPSFGIAPLEFLRWRKEIRSFESMALLRGATVNLTGAGAPEVLGAARISPEFFDTLKIRPLLGRWFQKEEEQRGRPDVAIISAYLWRQRLLGGPAHYWQQDRFGWNSVRSCRRHPAGYAILPRTPTTFGGGAS